MLKYYNCTLFVLLYCCCTQQAAGQTSRFTVSGFLKDSLSGEVLIGATIYDQQSGKGTVSNSYGFYSLTLPQDTVELIFSFIGYQSQGKRLHLTQNQTMNIFLVSANTLETVTVTAEATKRIEESTQMSSINIPVEQIRALPAALGEVDVLRTLQLLPGIQKGSEGSTGLYVRGGSPDQNLYLLDGVPLYNVSHLGGMFSVFNADALSNVELLKGGFPARYSGRLSSVLDIRMRDGNAKKIHGQGSIGIVSSKFALEGPLIKDKTTFMVSLRRTYLDLLTRPISLLASEGTVSAGYSFHDVNAKISHTISNKDRLFLSFYLGDDLVSARYRETFGSDKYQTKTRLIWGNQLTALRWNHVFTDKLFVNTTVNYTRYRFLVDIKSKSDDEESYFGFKSGIRDWSGRVDFEYYPNPQHSIRFGGQAVSHLFKPGITAIRYNDQQTERTDTSFGSSNIAAFETSLYAEDDWEISKHLKLNAGVNWSHSFVDGEHFQSFQPRIAARYLLPKQYSIKASYVVMQQFMHLLTNSDAGLPTDLWVPATRIAKPQFSRQMALGIAKSTAENVYEISVEGYYKRMTNLIDYKEGTTFLGDNQDWQTKIETGGKGESYGAEVLLQKKQGKLSGWVGYTLSWTNRQFQEINNGKTYPYRYDRRHDVGIALTYRPSERITLSASWMFGTGSAITLATGRYEPYRESSSYFWNSWGSVEDYNGRNGFRMRSFHKLDLGISFHKKKKWAERTWTFGLYNAYNRQNPFYYYVDEKYTYNNNGTSTRERKLKQVSLFPIIPSFNYSFKF